MELSFKTTLFLRSMSARQSSIGTSCQYSPCPELLYDLVFYSSHSQSCINNSTCLHFPLSLLDLTSNCCPLLVQCQDMFRCIVEAVRFRLHSTVQYKNFSHNAEHRSAVHYGASDKRFTMRLSALG